MDRRALLASGAAAALLVASGISAGAMPTRGGRLRAALSGASRQDTFDAREIQGLFMQVATVGTVFDTLTEVAADGTLRGELATHWHGDAGARNWIFRLREDANFHDGTPFSAKDAIASLRRLQGTILSDVVTFDAPDPYQLLVTLRDGDPDFPYRLTDPRLVMYPGEKQSEAILNGIGTGLYRVQDFQPGRHLRAARVTEHYKDGSYGWFEEIELVALSSDAVRAEALTENYVDVADLSHTADLLNLDGITLVPEEHFMTAAVDHTIALPAQTGTRWPLDNLRAAERWWMA
ncbi:MAG: ABC transporter substrate-binding protein [Pseudomonadota bacterium]